MNLGLLVAMAFLVVADVTGQLLLKRAADDSVGVGGAKHRVGAGSWQWVGVLLINVKFLGGLGLLVIWFLGYLGVLAHFEVARAFPMQSLSVLLLILFARLFLKEKVTVRRWLGGGLIGLGVLLLAS